MYKGIIIYLYLRIMDLHIRTELYNWGFHKIWDSRACMYVKQVWVVKHLSGRKHLLSVFHRAMVKM